MLPPVPSALTESTRKAKAEFFSRRQRATRPHHGLATILESRATVLRLRGAGGDGGENCAAARSDGLSGVRAVEARGLTVLRRLYRRRRLKERMVIARLYVYLSYTFDPSYPRQPLLGTSPCAKRRWFRVLLVILAISSPWLRIASWGLRFPRGSAGRSLPHF